MTVLTEEKIKSAAGEYDTSVVRRLHIADAGLSRLAGLGLCERLVELSLPGNALTEIEGLGALTALERLDLSRNSIRRIDNVAHLAKLVLLNLAGNRISNIDDTSQLGGLDGLASLYLQSQDRHHTNPCCEHPAYYTVVTRTVPNLTMLDGEMLQVRGPGTRTKASQLTPPRPFSPRRSSASPRRSAPSASSVRTRPPWSRWKSDHGPTRTRGRCRRSRKRAGRSRPSAPSRTAARPWSRWATRSSRPRQRGCPSRAVNCGWRVSNEAMVTGR